MSQNILKIHELEIKSFMSVGEEGHIFKFNDKIKTTIIVGDNGSGKSQIYEALNFLLFNKSYRKIKKANLINAFTKKGAYVRAKFESNGKLFEVTRTIKPDSFTVSIDGKEQDIEAGTAFQKRFISMIGFDEGFYRRTIVLGTSDYVEFMDLSIGGKVTFVDNVLELTTISKMDVINKGKIKNLKQESEVIEKDINNLDTRIGEMKSSDDQLHKLHQEGIKYATQRTNALRDNLTLSKEKVSENESILAQVIAPTGEEKPLLQYPVHVSTTKDEIERLNGLISVEQNKINEVSANKQLLMSTGKAKKQERDSLEGSDVCPTCKQQLKDHESIINRQKDLYDEMMGIANEIKMLPDTKINEEEQNKLRMRIVEIQNEERALIEQERSKVDVANNEIRDYNANIKNKILEYNQKQNEHKRFIDEVNRIASDLATEEKNLRELESKVIVDNKTKINDLKQEKLILIDKLDSITEELMDRTSVGKLLGNDGIRSDMINRYIPEFNKFMMAYLDLLGADYIFTIDSEFNERILSMGRENFEYSSFSRGEQARIDLAILFSWRKVAELVSGKQSSLLILDEVFDSATDDAGVKGIRKIIDDMGEGTNVIIISHKPHNKDDFDRVIEVKKLGRFSNYNVIDNI